MELIVRDEVSLKRHARRAYDLILTCLRAGQEKVLVVRDPKRTDAQNRLLHALLTEVSKRVVWAGAKRSVVVWKRLMVASWLRALGESPDVLPSLDHKGIEVIYERTSEMSVKQLNSLIEYVHSWMAEFCPLEYVVDPDTGEILHTYQPERREAICA